MFAAGGCWSLGYGASSLVIVVADLVDRRRRSIATPSAGLVSGPFLPRHQGEVMEGALKCVLQGVLEGVLLEIALQGVCI